MPEDYWLHSSPSRFNEETPGGKKGLEKRKTGDVRGRANARLNPRNILFVNVVAV